MLTRKFAQYASSPYPHQVSSAVLPPVGRRERKKAEVREALRDATLRLAIEHGYERVTIEAIANEADVSTRTFSNYFSSKEEALFAPDPDMIARFESAIAQRPATEAPLAALGAVLVELADHLAGRRDAWRARMKLVAATPQLRPRMVAQFTYFEQVMARAVAARTGRDLETDPYPALVAGAAASAMRVALRYWRTGTGEPLDRLLAAQLSGLAAGLPDAAAPPPRTMTTTEHDL